MNDSQISLVGGRQVAYTEIGKSNWPCVFFFHGAPMSRFHLAYIEQKFLLARVRVISPDRPGYGGSSPHAGRSMADWPSDVIALADALGIERFVVAGHSSGGPYALACAALIPERVLGGIVLNGVTDMRWPGAWDGYVDSERHLMKLPDLEAAITWSTRQFGADGSGFLRASDFELPEPDSALFMDEQAGPALMLAIDEAFRQGVAGYAQDILIQGRPWPFDPKAIVAPVHVMHGELDTFMPRAHSRHTSEMISRSVLHVLSGHGHITIVSELPTAVLCFAHSFS